MLQNSQAPILALAGVACAVGKREHRFDVGKGKRIFASGFWNASVVLAAGARACFWLLEDTNVFVAAGETEREKRDIDLFTDKTRQRTRAHLPAAKKTRSHLPAANKTRSRSPAAKTHARLSAAESMLASKQQKNASGSRRYSLPPSSNLDTQDPTRHRRAQKESIKQN